MTSTDNPMIHAVMYRDYKLGTLCDSRAWGPPMLHTTVTEKVTCPGCRAKLDGVAAPSPVNALLALPAASLKMLRESLCVAQQRVHAVEDDRNIRHSTNLGVLIEAIDVHRPLGPDGKHGARHTATCGCEDR